jgi:hypothetical protein
MRILHAGANGWKREKEYMTDNALIVFMKNPVRGKVKTRLAATLGNDKALQVYLDLVDYTREVLTEVKADIWLFYSDYLQENDNWSPIAAQKRTQLGADLGVRMKNAFREVFAAPYKHAAIIGTDCPELTPVIINKGFEQLTNCELVMGPAQDGGYYLLGLNAPNEWLFENKPWSTNQVAKLTLQAAEERQLNYELLPMLRDVDTEKDLQLTGFTKNLSFDL